MNTLPEIRKHNDIETLFVDGKPFFALGGEIHNSSSSSLEYMQEKVWPSIKDMDLNTLVVPITWEQLEKNEGEFNFEILEGLINQARENHIKLIILWFGLWKNSESMYVPGWMKKDTSKYFRAEKFTGEKINTISPFCNAAIEKDSLALSKIVSKIKEIDENHNTVIMIQAENEIGLLGTDRDYCPEAETKYNENIPGKVAEAFSANGTWEEVFKDSAWEYFMSYYFATAVEKIVSKSKSIYPLPFFTNAWLKQYPWFPGSYPSGGPVKSMHKIWKIAAPSLSTLAPDIYVPDVAGTMEEYSYEGNPLVIPEVRKDAVTASYALHAFTKYNAICYSPFGIEELSLHPDEIDKPPMGLMIALNIDPDAFEIEGSKKYLSLTYRLFKNFTPLYLKYRGTDKLKSFLKSNDYNYGTLLEFSKYNLQVSYKPKEKNKPVSSGVIIEVSENSFFAIGMNYGLKVHPKPGAKIKTDFLKIEEGSFINGEWKPGRILNGDEKMFIELKDEPSCLYIEVFEY